MTFKTYIDFETDNILYDGKIQIVRALEGNLSLDDLNGGIKPGDIGEFGSCGSNSYDTNQPNEDLKKCYELLQAGHKEDTDEQSESSTSYASAQETIGLFGSLEREESSGEESRGEGSN